MPHYDRVLATCRYAYPLDNMIQACKYGGRLSMIRALASLLPDKPQRLPDLIVAMPLSPQRLRERGFNQALELARDVARRMRLPVDADVCAKIHDTPPQTMLPWKARRRNVRGAFVVRTRLDGLHIAVVDDVLTTGATLDELARSLKKSGATSVTGWIVARTIAGSDTRRQRPW
ncbi:MAG: ComF family protein [Burkholderiales bacterium]